MYIIYNHYWIFELPIKLGVSKRYMYISIPCDEEKYWNVEPYQCWFIINQKQYISNAGNIVGIEKI